MSLLSMLDEYTLDHIFNIVHQDKMKCVLEEIIVPRFRYGSHTLRNNWHYPWIAPHSAIIEIVNGRAIRVDYNHDNTFKLTGCTSDNLLIVPVNDVMTILMEKNLI